MDTVVRDPAMWMGGGSLLGNGLLYLYINNLISERDKKIADLQAQIAAMNENMRQVGQTVLIQSKKENEGQIKSVREKLEKKIKKDIGEVHFLINSRSLQSQYEYDPRASSSKSQSRKTPTPSQQEVLPKSQKKMKALPPPPPESDSESDSSDVDSETDVLNAF